MIRRRDVMGPLTDDQLPVLREETSSLAATERRLEAGVPDRMASELRREAPRVAAASSPSSWSDAVLLESARRIDHESRVASADLARLEADRARRLLASASSGAASTDVKRSNETASDRIGVVQDLIEALALRRAAIEAELVTRALQPEKEPRSEGRSSLPGEQETLAADAVAMTTAGPVAIR